MVARAIALLSLCAAAAGWAVARSAEISTLMLLGLVALPGGIAALSFPVVRPRLLRALCATFTLTALPGTLAVPMVALAGSFEPYAINFMFASKSLYDLDVPVASEGTFCDAGIPRWILNLPRGGEIRFMGGGLSLAGLSGILPPREEANVLLRADRGAPWLHVAWILDAVRATGANEICFQTRKYAGRAEQGEDLSAIGASWHAGDWPDLTLRQPLATRSSGPTLRIRAVERKAILRPVPGTEQRVETPSRVRYELDGHSTLTLSELAAWMRENPPARLEPEADVPFKFVVAVLNELLRAGQPLPALLTPYAPREKYLRYLVLPWPEAD